MVRSDGIDYLRFLLVLLSQLHSENCMRQLRLVIGHLAYVMQQSCPLGQLRVKTQFSSHYGAQVGHFARVLQKVLSV